ncbi:YdeI/OmpD-associated family protein [Viridibacillus sp. NPDC096237]|uniref:YdeI/OmpD-associated family protein n=1 Tax=Viridibacillus sp. NPDC096237 TaxID=3390721 RepID=UPI003D01F958
MLREVVESKRVKDKGYLFVAYPKKNNKEYTEYIERDTLFPAISPDEEGYVLKSTMKFAHMVSFNDTFTVVGIKNEPKKVKKTTTKKASQCVGDYVSRISDIQQYLKNQREIIDFYNVLAPGYQRDWARFVYSAKRTETQEKRLSEMAKILGEGFKTMNLYRANKK